MSRTGIVGDIHAPFTHSRYRQFISDTFDKWGVNKVVFIGDVVDNHAISFHDHDPDGRSAGDEADHAERDIEKWKLLFPRALVCIGNHDERTYRLARKHGLPTRHVRGYADVWDTPQWKWEFEHCIDGVSYTHGTGTSGKDAAINLALQRRKSVAIGHTHTWPGVKWHSNPDNLIFGMNVGCGIDTRSYAFAYGRDFPTRPVLGCGIVIDGEEAYFVPMKCGPGQKYHRRRV